MSNMIKYKTIKHEVIGDAPFMGALICANSCPLNCRGCFNKSLKKQEPLEKSAEDIIAEVKSNPLNQGIILAGLEWSAQPMEMLELMSVASKNGLEIIVYTGYKDPYTFHSKIGEVAVEALGKSKEDIEKEYEIDVDGYRAFMGALAMNTVTDYKGYYLKYGSYDYKKKTYDNIQYGVSLASSNQKIIKIEPKRVDVTN